MGMGERLGETGTKRLRDSERGRGEREGGDTLE